MKEKFHASELMIFLADRQNCKESVAGFEWAQREERERRKGGEEEERNVDGVSERIRKILI